MPHLERQNTDRKTEREKEELQTHIDIMKNFEGRDRER